MKCLRICLAIIYTHDPKKYVTNTLIANDKLLFMPITLTKNIIMNTKIKWANENDLNSNSSLYYRLYELLLK